MAIAVVVCAFSADRRRMLERGVDAVHAQLGVGDRLIVVIDHNDALLRELRVPAGVTLLPNRFRPGLSGARNTGLAAARGDIVAFVDDDATVWPGWLDALRAHYLDPAVAAVGGYALPVWPARRPGWFPEEFDWVVGCSHRGLPTSTTEVRNLIGCNMTFRRSALAGVGGFSSRVGRVGATPLGCEETELCIRLGQSCPDARILLDPGIRVHHTVSPERVRLGYFVRRCFAEGLSKHMVGAMVGTGPALSSERDYVARVLPAAMRREVRGALRGPERRDSLARAAAMMLGLAATALGYAVAAARAVSTRAGPDRCEAGDDDSR